MSTVDTDKAAFYKKITRARTIDAIFKIRREANCIEALEIVAMPAGVAVTLYEHPDEMGREDAHCWLVEDFKGEPLDAVKLCFQKWFTEEAKPLRDQEF